MSTTALLRVLPLVSLLSCTREVTSPLVTTEGTYVLREVEKREVPTVLVEGGGQRYTIIADTLRFFAHGEVMRAQVMHHEGSTSLGSMGNYTTTYTWPYERRGLRVTIGRLAQCAPNANCVGTHDGRFTMRGLVIDRHANFGTNAKLYFERID
jgi:hypothetical protein